MLYKDMLNVSINGILKHFDKLKEEKAITDQTALAYLDPYLIKDVKVTVPIEITTKK